MFLLLESLKPMCSLEFHLDCGSLVLTRMVRLRTRVKCPHKRVNTGQPTAALYSFMSLPDWQGCLELWAGSAACPSRVTPRELGNNVAFGSVLSLAGQCSWTGMEVAQEFISGKDHKEMERLRVKGGSKGGIMTQMEVCDSQCFPGLPRSYMQPPTWSQNKGIVYFNSKVSTED